MKTLAEILLDVDNRQKVELMKIIDKSVPSGIIEKRIDMLKKEDSAAILSLINCNILFKRIVLSELNYVEDMLSTGVYNSKYGQVKCKELLENPDYSGFWPKDPKNKNKEKFRKIITFKNSKSNDKFLEQTLFEVFYSRTLGGKILLVGLMDRDVSATLIKSNTKKFKKEELISLLEYSKNIRNHVAHNFFVLNKGPYLRMVQKSDISKHGLKDDNSKIQFLFSKIESLLKINSRTHPVRTLRKEIAKDDKINLKHLDIMILEKK